MSLSGHYEYQNYWNDLYYNSYSVNNTPPGIPSNLFAQEGVDSVTFSWDAVTDYRTPSAGLTYNLRVGSTPGGNDIVSSMSNPATGWRKIARPGNAGQRLFYEVQGLAPGVYYWSVQAVDVSFAGSAFAPEHTLNYGVSNDDPQISPILKVSNSPNPFSNGTVLNLETVKAGRVTGAIYNLKGQLVKQLNDSALASGNHSFGWDAKDEAGLAVASGIFTARIGYEGKTIIHKLMLVK